MCIDCGSFLGHGQQTQQEDVAQVLSIWYLQVLLKALDIEFNSIQPLEDLSDTVIDSVLSVICLFTNCINESTEETHWQTQ